MSETPWFVMRSDLAGGPPEGACPDIILGGPKPDPNYAQQYDTAFNRIGHFGGSNYVYVRAINGDTAQAIGSVMVYATRLGGLPNQSEWLQLKTSDGRDSTNISADAGKVGVTGAPLIWKAGEAPPPEAPWCLVAEIVGDDHPAVQVPTTVADKAGFDAWVADQPRLNYVIVQAPNVVTTGVPTFGWSRMVELANAHSITLTASLTCTKGPAGGSLSFSFDKSDSSGRPIGIGKTQYQIGTVYSQTRTVPADYSSTVSIAYIPALDDHGEAEFTFQVATITGEDDDGDLGTSTTTPIAGYTLSFGQVPGLGG